MARTSIPITTVAAGGAQVPAGTTIDQANGMVISTVNTGLPSFKSGNRLFLEVTNTAAGAHVITIRAGVTPPAHRAGLGDLTSSVIATTGRQLIGPLDLSRHAQADGSINVDWDAGSTGIVNCWYLPDFV